MVTYVCMYANRGEGDGGKGGGGREKVCAGIQVAVWACLQTNTEFRVKRLDWVK